MKKIIYKKLIYRILFSCMAAILILMPACKKDSNAPVITDVRNYAPTPGDSLLQKMIPGQWVAISGHNLKDAVQISFDGIPASFNSALFSDSYAVVQLPAVIPFPSVSADKFNTIEYVTSGGKTTFTFNIVAPAPAITGVSNENAVEGDYVYIYGTNLFFINKITFAGTPITTYTLSNDGTAVGFVLPALTKSGKVVIDAQAGSDSTVYNVNDVTTGVLCNFDDISTLDWGCGTDNSSTTFPGNRGYYAVLNPGVITSGDGSWWNGGRGINLKAGQWVPVDSLGVSIDKYAFKFEINVPDAWKDISIFVLKDYSWNYLARYEPWKDANGNTFKYKTNGWTTVTIPFSNFRKDDGKGAAITSLTDFLGNTGNGSVHIHTMNKSASDASFYGAIDNIRVVKIKK
jgi:hypothetical protein